MAGIRIQFPVDDAARFNALRDQWRDVAAGSKLAKIGHRVANVLPKYLSREFGYCFPTDDDVADTLHTTARSINRGMVALETADLIERHTIVRRDQKGEAAGRLRRIYLTLPNRVGERTGSEQTEVNGQAEVNGPNRVGERTDVCPNKRDKYTPDNKNRSEAEVHVYVPVREGYPKGYSGDDDFLDAFDRTVMEMTDGRQIAAGEFETIIEQAFDRTTKSNDGFMPFYWVDVCALNSNDTQNWFRRRTGQIIHRRAA
ncbi:hypothetical protein F9K96_00375 [Brucella anthropi]|uniref:hypothetical protein n=1 Tax=Brucella anthropi TaxID=529 RepID=UPI00124E3C56|nr:hypothetical protein [Brucella anthropi]KAB2793665.1 hypothetical protein F9K96_00375 [Brucella anthropi]